MRVSHTESAVQICKTPAQYEQALRDNKQHGTHNFENDLRWVGTDGLLWHEMGNIAFVAECLGRCEIVNKNRGFAVEAWAGDDTENPESFAYAPIAEKGKFLWIAGKSVEEIMDARA